MNQLIVLKSRNQEQGEVYTTCKFTLQNPQVLVSLYLLKLSSQTKTFLKLLFSNSIFQKQKLQLQT